MRAVFLDKDGTLIEDVPYNVQPERMHLMPGAGAALRLLRDAGYTFFVVSNQAGVALGRFAEAELERVGLALQQLLAEHEVRLTGFYYCPHHPAGTVASYSGQCTCRKPRPGLLRRAAAEHGIDLNASWLIGDILDDIEAGRRAGCRTVLLDNGHETEWRPGPGRRPHYVARDLTEAASCILSAPCAMSADSVPCTR